MKSRELQTRTLGQILEALWQVKESLDLDGGGGNKRAVKKAWREIILGNDTSEPKLVLHVGHDHFLVSSDSRTGEFHSVDSHDITCSCESYVLGGRFCKHLELVKQLDKKGLLPKN